MKIYPKLVPDTIEDMKTMLRYINKERPNDVSDFENLKNVFMSGRKVAKVPTGASDVALSDRVGDFNYDDAYFYLLTTDGLGAAVWGRIALDTSW